MKPTRLTQESQRRLRIVLSYFLAAILGVVVWNWSRSLEAYTLYRTSMVDEGLRVYIATFAGEGVDYNRGNCQIAAGLFQTQPGLYSR